MARTRTPVVHDADFDADEARPQRGLRMVGTRWLGEHPQDFQRLLANPFLAVAFLVMWIAAAPWLLFGRPAGWVVPTYASLIAIRYLLQFHCLDCGKTGRLGTWREHRCEAVRYRIEAGQIRWRRGPTPGTQSVFWAIVFITGAVCLFAALDGS
jgi:hypothetical protein